VAQEDSRQAATYRLRIDLGGTEPPLWRQLEVASDLFLDELHWIIQVAFGWADRPLHEFQVHAGADAIPEEEVRLDQVLVRRGDKLSYAYDFGDGWAHFVKLEAVLPRSESIPNARCLAGHRDGPAGDCGGISGYETLACLTGEPDDGRS
jgi:Plasmid pRiA4b ORF-3-like protein